MLRTLILPFVFAAGFVATLNLRAADVNGVQIGWGSQDGRVLLSELSCAACHASDVSNDVPRAKQAPLLGDVGSRVTPQYLRAYLANPHAVKPGTSMPHVLHALDGGEQEDTVEALVHFLVSLGGPIDQRASGSSLAQIERGKSLYHSIGCVACHQSFERPPKHKIDPAVANTAEEETPDAENTFAPIPHGELSMKTTVSALAEFLDNPHAVRPSGRMPNMNLRPGEANLLAAYLLRDQYDDQDVAPGVGLDLAYYKGNWPKVPDFEKLTPTLETDAKSFDVNQIKLENGQTPKSGFAVRFQGLIQIPADGEYRFWIKSDDGSLLWIDGRTIIDNDGMHPPQERDGAVQLTKGPHTIEVGFVQGGGGFELSVAWQPPGGKREPIPAGILMHSAAAMIPKGIVDFKVDVAKADRGRQLFASLGCASCHDTRRTDSESIKSTLNAKPLAKLNASAAGGCLDKSVVAARPQFMLSDAQRASLRQALLERQQNKQRTDEQLVSHTMSVLNCFACHQRGDQGGPADDRSDYFAYEILVDLGDEGRLPPSLDEVGAKLTDQGFDDVLFGGQRYRTYMATRMPQYGKQNIGRLPELLAKLDAGIIPSHEPAYSNRMVDDGRRLVGKNALACINCHAWGTHRLPGAEGLDLQLASRRIRPEWFHALLVEPQLRRPRTRMPSPFPQGKTFFDDIQNGDVDRQIDAIWAYLRVGEKGGLPNGLSPEDKSLLTPTDEPITFRTFVDGVSAHAIAVGFRERTNVVFDANRVRSVAAWTGDFISAKSAWDGRAGQYAKIEGINVVRFPEGPPLAKLESMTQPWPTDLPKAKLGSSRTPAGWRFRGYRFDERRVPTFLYNVDDIQVEETPGTDPRPDSTVLLRRFNLTSNENVSEFYLRVATGKSIVEKDGKYTIDGGVSYRAVRTESRPTVRTIDGNQELIVPIKFKSTAKDDFASSVELELQW